MTKVCLNINLASLKLRNPLILASGILGTSGSLLKRVALAGAGAVTTKSISRNPRWGYKNPTVIKLEYGLINAIGLSNPGINEFKNEIKIAKEGGVPVIVSIFGSEINEFVYVASQAEEAGADAIELNLSCPHGPNIQYGQNPKLAYEVVNAVKNVLKIPVFAKLTPEVIDIVEIGKSVEKAGADAVTAINTLKAMIIDIKLAKPVLSNIYGGLSGNAIKPIALRCVYQLYDSLNIPIIGVGGIMNYEDAIEFMMAGASAVQIGSAIAFKGINIFNEIEEGIVKFMEEEGYKSIKDIIGLAHKG
ncbi:MAG: dihydroorotate dehydrogenase [Candidatus Methanomethylicia archaeon]|nr:dihydroorotate dehydrogenase [Candidatus Methanomethylicia archaeon]MCX8169225.1 dihydroorotate dehydrogenase [Candidatus Methanomethylicia archaeon]MDW7988993.1 dihydroorotate dehydrogenase [Nitrososphaerota archaeon]